MSSSRIPKSIANARTAAEPFTSLLRPVSSSIASSSSRNFHTSSPSSVPPPTPRSPGPPRPPRQPRFQPQPLSFPREPAVPPLAARPNVVPAHTEDSGPPRDHDIPHRQVQYVDPDTGHLTPLQPLSTLLSQTDLRTYLLKLVSSDPPIVRRFSRAEEDERERQALLKVAERKSIQTETKELQISWTSAIGDLTHKVTLAKKVLAQGDRVELIFAPRGAAWKDKTNDKQKGEIVKMFEEALLEVGEKFLPDSNKGRAISCFWQPKSEIREGAVKEVQEHRAVEKKVRDEKKEARRLKDEERRRKAEEARSMGVER